MVSGIAIICMCYLHVVTTDRCMLTVMTVACPCVLLTVYGNIVPKRQSLSCKSCAVSVKYCVNLSIFLKIIILLNEVIVWN